MPLRRKIGHPCYRESLRGLIIINNTDRVQANNVKYIELVMRVCLYLFDLLERYDIIHVNLPFACYLFKKLKFFLNAAVTS